MKYRDTSLKGKNNYLLIRENDSKKFLDSLDKLKEVKPYLASNIHGFSETYDAASKFQAYLIFSGESRETYLGGLAIIPPIFEDEPIEFRIYIDEDKITSEKEIYQIINELITLLSRCFYTAETLTIKLENDVDLAKWNGQKYKKSSFEWTENTYSCLNTFHEKLTTIFAEIIKIKKNAQENGIEEIEEKVIANPKKFIWPIDNSSITEYRKNQVPFSEVFDKADIFNLSFKLPDSSFISADHYYNGKVFFKNSSLRAGREDENYCGNYNLFNNDFQLIDSGNNLEIHNDQEKYSLSDDYITITNNQNYNIKTINYNTDITENNTSTVTKIVLKDNQLKQCYLDLRIHHPKMQKINGTLMFRWNSNRRLCLEYHNRKGTVQTDLTEILEKSSPNLFNKFLTDNPNLEDLDTLISEIVSIANSTLSSNIFDDICLEHLINTLEKNSLNFLESVAKDAYSSYLIEQLSTLSSKLNDTNKKTKKLII